MLLLLPFAFAGAPVPLQGYEAVRIALVADQKEAAAAAARAYAGELADPQLVAAANELAAAPDLPAMRHAFATLSRGVVLQLDGTQKVYVYHCPMTTEWGWWVQTQPGMQNPYMGAAMPVCGEGVSLKSAQKAGR